MKEEERIYKLMDWEQVEEVVYSECDNPHSILGAKVTEEGILIQSFMPGAKEVKVLSKGEEYTCCLEDEAGYFAALIPGKKVPEYLLRVVYEDRTVEVTDPYNFKQVISNSELEKFNSGVNYEIYEKLGAHVIELEGVKGTLFAVWAPNAVRVSVVGDFNSWDGRIHQMRRLGGSGVFELFIPGVLTGAVYKYEIKAKGGLTYLKADPYANEAELRPSNASIVTDINSFKWSDSKWLEKRKKENFDKKPMYIYEVHLGSFKKPKEENGSFYNYRELAVMIADYVKKMGYTHIELMPVMEHPFDGSWGYQVTGYYAATKRYGTPEDFMYFMDYMHKEGIGVILDWVPAHFPRDTFGLSAFDGTCLYEHFDPRKGAHPHWGTLIYNYGRPEVSNFLISNALFWVEKYHADGIRMDAVASMLYLDYGKNNGEWIANENGGNENLEAVAFLRHLSEVFHKKKNGALLIAEESTAWPMVTGAIKEGGLGFDIKWNMGWMNDFTNYMKLDPLFRKGAHGSLTFSMIYAYSENFVLVLSHDEVVHGKCSMLNKMPGTLEQKFSNLRAAYAFMITHPGKKLIFMGQDIAQLREWSEERSVDWNLLDEELHAKLNLCQKDLIELYKSYPALYELDTDYKGFEWVSSLDADRSIVTFVRKTKKKEETLFVVCNFTPVVYEAEQVGVPFAGKYKEIFNSDNVKYGGLGNINARAKQSKPIPVYDRKNSVTMTIPPLGVAIFTCTPQAKPVKATENDKNIAKKSVTELKPVKETKAKAETAKEAKPEVKAEVKTAKEAKPEAKAKTETAKEAKTEEKKAAVRKTTAKKPAAVTKKQK